MSHMFKADSKNRGMVAPEEYRLVGDSLRAGEADLAVSVAGAAELPNEPTRTPSRSLNPRTCNGDRNVLAPAPYWTAGMVVSSDGVARRGRPPSEDGAVGRTSGPCEHAKRIIKLYL